MQVEALLVRHENVDLPKAAKAVLKVQVVNFISKKESGCKSEFVEKILEGRGHARKGKMSVITSL